MADPVPPETRTYDESTSEEMDVWGHVGAIAAGLSILACGFAAAGNLIGGKLTIAAIAAGWAIIPPVWFWWEYFFRFRTKRSTPGTFEYFKHGQQLGVAVWAGIAASIGAFAISPLSDPKADRTPELKCTLQSVAAAASTATSYPIELDVRLRCRS